MTLDDLKRYDVSAELPSAPGIYIIPDSITKFHTLMAQTGIEFTDHEEYIALTCASTGNVYLWYYIQAFDVTTEDEVRIKLSMNTIWVRK